MLKILKHPHFFYGWVIVGISLVGMTLIYGIRHSFSVFFPSILDEFGWARGSTAVMLSLHLLIYGFLAPVAGSLGDRWKPRRVMPIGIIILSLATAGCAFAHELWHFYLLFGILAPMGTAFSGWPLLAPTTFAGTADIFHGRHFGAIAGLLLTGQGLGGAIGPWLGGYIYDISGSYRSSFVLCMVCFALTCITVWIAAPRNADRLRARA